MTGSSGRQMSEVWSPCGAAWLLSLTLISLGIGGAMGLDFVLDPSGSRLWQLLDARALVADYWGSLWRLHSQPPLLNAVFGAALILFGPEQGPVVLQGLWYVGLFLLLRGLALLLRRMGASPRMNRLLLVLLAISPNVLMYTHVFIYSMWVAPGLVWCAVYLDRFAQGGKRGDAVRLFTVATLLVFSRALLHPIWLLGVLGLTLWTASKRDRQRLFLFATVPVLLTAGWLAKNSLLVDSPAMSSWLGMNLRRGWNEVLEREEHLALLEAGTLEPVWRGGAFGTVELYERYGAWTAEWCDLSLANTGCAADADCPLRQSCQSGRCLPHPVLCALRKKDGSPNLNHQAYVPVSQALTRNYFALISERPGRFGERLQTSMSQYLDPGPTTVFGWATNQRSRACGSGEPDEAGTCVCEGGWSLGEEERCTVHAVGEWSRLYNGLLFLSFSEPTEASGLNLMALYVLLLSLVGSMVLWRRRNELGVAFLSVEQERAGPAAPTLLFILATILWTTAVSIVVEVGELERMRWEIEPLYLALFPVLWREGRRRFRGS